MYDKKHEYKKNIQYGLVRSGVKKRKPHGEKRRESLIVINRPASYASSASLGDPQ